MEDQSQINWDEKIQEYRNSGIGLERWCRQNNISKSAMSYHIYGKYKSKKKSKSNDEMMKLVPLIVAEEPAALNRVITLNVNGVSIDVDDDTDLLLLKKIVGVLR